MKHLTWPAVLVFIAVLATLAAIFGLSDDAAMRQQILGYFDSIVPFILGVGAGAAAGGAGGYAGGYLKGFSNARAELQKSSENGAAQPDAVRRAAEAVRVAAEESHQAADEARAAVEALRVAAEEGRTVAEEQRALLADTRRTAGASQDAQHPAWTAVRGGAQLGAHQR